MNLRALIGVVIVQYVAFTLTVFAGNLAYAEGIMGSCPMCGPMGWGGMLIGAAIGIALFTFLIVGTVYLVKKTRQLPR